MFLSIDADLNAGVIDQETAKKRREELSQESDFFGSMDGASKFVKGDAMAAAAEPDLLCTEGDSAAAFERTASRLIEMQSEAYIRTPHGGTDGG